MKNQNKTLEQRLHRLAGSPAVAHFPDNLLGLEKESLRVSPSGTLSSKSHPEAFGSALTHPYVTTDFSEALLEMITPAVSGKDEALGFLRDLHTYIYRHLDDEVLWATSMPCVLEGARSIPLARYGASNAARMKTVYRRGLGNRYGRVMQVIAGVHYNFSFADAFWPEYRELEGKDVDLVEFRSESYMAMVRNLQRFGWLVPYLFGASPAVCKSFAQGVQTDLEEFDSNTFYYPYGTSLRMGDIGYQNSQTGGAGMKASYDSLDAYVRSLTWAIETPCPHYEAIGVKVGDRYEQLNANLLQIENEYYSTVRPKQILEWLEKPTLALRHRGVRYIELRSLDVDAFNPLGVGAEQLHFMDAFMLFCLLTDSPGINARERLAIDDNLVLAAHQGRDPKLELHSQGGEVTLRRWIAELLDAMVPAAELMDGRGDGPCSASLKEQREKVVDPDRTPSARMLAEMRSNGEGFYHYAKRVSAAHHDYFRELTLSREREDLFLRLRGETRQRQEEIEAADDTDFDEFLERYFAQQASTTPHRKLR